MLAAAIAVVAIGAIIVGGRGALASVTERHADPARQTMVIGARQGFARDSLAPPRTCGPAPRSSGYVNPLWNAVVRGERIDQGVDYAGRGSLASIGTARITYVGTSGTGWPGAFIEYRLLTGPDSGCYVYYAEGIDPVGALRIGQTVHAGQRLATIIPGWSTGVELGWGAGKSTVTYAARAGGWTADDDAGNIASAAGRSFSALVADLGGPAGRVEG